MKRIAAGVIACFLVIGLFARTASAQRAAESDAPTATPAQVQLASAEAKDKLKADVTRLVADAKAGKLKVPVQHFPQPKRNNLSKGAKIAIVAGIAGAVIFIILWYTTGPGSD